MFNAGCVMGKSGPLVGQAEILDGPREAGGSSGPAMVQKGLYSYVSPGGPKLDPVAEVVGHQLSRGLDTLYAGEESRFEDPLLWEVHSALQAPSVLMGPKVAHELGGHRWGSLKI